MTLLVDYYEAVKGAARRYLQPLYVSDLERLITIPSWPTPSIGLVLGVLVFHNCVPGGLIGYLRGYYKGMGRAL